MVAPSAPSAGSRGAERSRGPGRCLRLLRCAPPCASAPSLPSLRPPLTPGSMEVMEGPLNLVSGSQRVASALGSVASGVGSGPLGAPTLHARGAGAAGVVLEAGGRQRAWPTAAPGKPSRTVIPSGIPGKLSGPFPAASVRPLPQGLRGGRPPAGAATSRGRRKCLRAPRKHLPAARSGTDSGQRSRGV